MSCKRWQLLAYLLVGSVAAEETTTGNLINDYGWSESGGILNHYNHHHTDYQGGSVTQSIDISEYEGQLSYNYNTTVYGCGNTIGGDCSSGVTDTFTVTLTLDTGQTWTDTIVVINQWEEVDLTYTPTEDASLATIELYGQDNGFWAGWYGPVFYSGSFTVTFDPELAARLAEEEAARLEAERLAAEQAAAEAAAAQAALEAAEALAAEEEAKQELATNTVTMDSVYSAPVVEVPVVEVSPMETTTIADNPMPEIQTPVATPQPTAAPQPTQTVQAQPQQQQQSQEQPKSESKSSGTVSVKTAAGVVSANIDTATASTASIGDAFGDPSNPVAQAVMVAVMASNGANLTEARLVQPELPKPPRMRERGLENRFWLDSLRSEVRFQKHMVDKQWQN